MFCVYSLALHTSVFVINKVSQEDSYITRREQNCENKLGIGKARYKYVPFYFTVNEQQII